MSRRNARLKLTLQIGYRGVIPVSIKHTFNLQMKCVPENCLFVCLFVCFHKRQSDFL